jgi:hypothetical protein
MPYDVLVATTGTTTPDAKVGIEYYVETLPGTHTVQHDPNTGSTVVNCIVAWSDLDIFMWEMLGYSQAAGTTIQRVLPERCPWSYGPHYQYALKASVIQLINHTDNDANGWPEFEKAKVQVTFGAPLYNVYEDGESEEWDRFVVWERKVVANNEKIPSGGFKFVSDTPPTPLGEVVVKTGRVIELKAKWIDIPDIAFNKLSIGMGKINNAAITYDEVEYPAETLLYLGFDEVRRVNSFGQLQRDIVLKFEARCDGRTWNAFWRKNKTTGEIEYEEPEDDLGNKVYESFDMTQLWYL